MDTVSRPIVNKQLVFDRQGISDDAPHTTRAKNLDGRDDQMKKENHTSLHCHRACLHFRIRGKIEKIFEFRYDLDFARESIDESELPGLVLKSGVSGESLLLDVTKDAG